MVRGLIARGYEVTILHTGRHESDEIPTEVHIAVPEGSHRPTIDYPPTRVRVFQAETFNLGRIGVSEEHGERFWISDRERTVVDAFRMRRRVSDDMAHAALRRYVGNRPKLARLAEMAGELRAGTAFNAVLRALQA